MNQGFSLTEILVALVLISGTSLALLKQQWHVTHLFNQAQFHADALLQLDNATEQLLAGDLKIFLLHPYQLQQRQTKENIMLQVYGLAQLRVSRLIKIPG